MAKKLEEIVVPKEEANFWLDNQGQWHIPEGKFQNKKIIDYFHLCIRKDKDGYHLTQDYKDTREKVYFHYEDTALFVFDVLEGRKGLTLVLNTKKRFKLKQKKLFIENGELYTTIGREKVKFAEDALVSISKFFGYDEGLWITIGTNKYKIQGL